MASVLPSELDNDSSVASSPRSEYDLPTRVRFMCTFGGKILPRPNDNQLTYVGGDNRMISVHRNISFASLLNKLSKLSGTSKISVKYQLPNEDLDALISVSTDEDVENMMDEYDRVVLNQNPRSARFRLFLFNNADHEDSDSRASSISSLLDSSANRERWFLDALNSGGGSGAGIERVRSEASSVASEVPDYLFGLDNSEEAQSRDLKPKIRREVSIVSDPGSPAPVVSSPFGSTSSAPVIRSSTPELPPVKTKPENPVQISEPNRSNTEVYPVPRDQPVFQQSGFSGSPAWHYSPHAHHHHPGHAVNQSPVYYVPGSVPPANPPVQHIPLPAQYIPHYQVQTGQHMPMGYHASHPVQVHGGPAQQFMVAMDAYGQPTKFAADVPNQKGYYGIKNPGPFNVYHPGMAVSGADDPYRTNLDSNQGQFS